MGRNTNLSLRQFISYMYGDISPKVQAKAIQGLASILSPSKESKFTLLVILTD